MKFDFDDILIKPAVLTNINSRSEIDPTTMDDMLPLFTAPMDTVVCDDNVDYFINAGITTILPRKQNIDSSYISTNKNCWYAYGLNEFRDVFLLSTPDNRGAEMYALIDVANGHMPALKTALIEAKEKYGDQIIIMVGNIANPYTYVELSNAGADYIRIGIGNGGGCLTTQQTGIGYPMASLISECRKIKTTKPNVNTKIVADGGFKKYSDVIKALALGADFVMLGSILNKCLESAGETTKHRESTLGGYEVVNQFSEEVRKMFDVDIPLFKTFRGMSTKEVQMSWGKENLTTSEGVVRTQKVEYTIEGWVDNFESYLKSAMSYTNKKELHHFIGGVKYNHISMNAFRRFDK